MNVAAVDIVGLGAQGDGVALLDGTSVFVPFAAPGDHARIEVFGPKGDGLAAKLLEVVTPGPARAKPVCGHFGVCGGCAVQHIAPDAYRDWKRGLVAQVLAHRGLDLPTTTRFIAIPPATRRRAVFAARKQQGVLRFGFHAPESHAIVDLAECPVLTPRLFAALSMLRNLADTALTDGQEADVTVNETETGLDVLFATAKGPGRRQALIKAAATLLIARLSWRTGRALPEILLQHHPARLTFGGVAVDLPPDAFLQPSLAGETALVEAVVAFAQGRKAIADLYAGCGTFTFALAKLGKVAAFEVSKSAVAALVAAVNRAQLSGRVTATARDLDQSPLPPQELKPFDCVVFDPPRAGARAQAEMFVRAQVKRLVAVSCNPASFARDARILIDGGYRLRDLVIVDQFLWSAHVEIVARFDR